MRNGFTPLPEEVLKQAFMRQPGDERPRWQSKKDRVIRRLPGSAALSADLLFAQLARQGLDSPMRVRWVLGHQPELMAWAAGCSDALDESALEALLELLRAAEGHEERLSTGRDTEDSSWAPAEEFLRRVFCEVGPLSVVEPRVDLALAMARFDAEASQLRKAMGMGLHAIKAVLQSTAMPAFLRGVLLLGNYVNSASRSLSGAVGVTLESVAKLAHTRCLPPGATQRKTRQNALHLLVWQLERERRGFLGEFAADLAGCRAACDLDLRTMREAVRRLGGHVDAAERRIALGHSSGEPAALEPSRLEAFGVSARPSCLEVNGLLGDLEGATAALRRHFAEPVTSSLSDMMANLAALHEGLPLAEPRLPAGTAARRVFSREHFESRRRNVDLICGSDVAITDGFGIQRRCTSAPPTVKKRSEWRARSAPPLRGNRDDAPKRKRSFSARRPGPRQSSRRAHQRAGSSLGLRRSARADQDAVAITRTRSCVQCPEFPEVASEERRHQSSPRNVQVSPKTPPGSPTQRAHSDIRLALKATTLKPFSARIMSSFDTGREQPGATNC